jgi:hypothetical protein
MKIFSNVQHPGKLADRAISMMNIATNEKQQILEELDIYQRIEKSTVIVNREIQRLELSEKIQTDVQDEISKSQREYYLRQQMKAIQKELGDDESNIEVKELEEKVKIIDINTCNDLLQKDELIKNKDITIKELEEKIKLKNITNTSEIQQKEYLIMNNDMLIKDLNEKIKLKETYINNELLQQGEIIKNKDTMIKNLE